MIGFYVGGGPNPRKVALFLEEAGLAYERIWVDTGNGEQFSPDFAALNPNGKVPVIRDGDRVVISLRRWHKIVVDGQTDEEAIADYEREHGAILGQNEGVILRVIVGP